MVGDRMSATDVWMSRKNFRTVGKFPETWGMRQESACGAGADGFPCGMMEVGMPNRITNAAGVPLQTLSVEMPVEVYKALRIAAALKNTNMSRFMRTLLENYLAAQQVVPGGFPDVVETTEMTGSGPSSNGEEPIEAGEGDDT
jgi:hypothetical protein